MFQKIFQKLLQEFFVTMGRAPGTPGEWMSIQDDVVVAADSTVDTDGGDLRVTGVSYDNGDRALGLTADAGGNHQCRGAVRI